MQFSIYGQDMEGTTRDINKLVEDIKSQSNNIQIL